MDQLNSDKDISNSRKTKYDQLQQVLFQIIEQNTETLQNVLCAPKLRQLLNEIRELRENGAERILVFAQERKVAVLLGYFLGGDPLTSPSGYQVYPDQIEEYKGMSLF